MESLVSNIDERILHILKTVAVEKLHYDDTSEWCSFCDGEEIWPRDDIKFDQIAHKPDCTMLFARAILKEMGMSLYGYKVSYEKPRLNTKKAIINWFRVTQFVEAFSEDDIRKEYPEANGKPTRDATYYRGVKVEQVETLT